jgi:hypothetical protein
MRRSHHTPSQIRHNHHQEEHAPIHKQNAYGPKIPDLCRTITTPVGKQQLPPEKQSSEIQQDPNQQSPYLQQQQLTGTERNNKGGSKKLSDRQWREQIRNNRSGLWWLELDRKQSQTDEPEPSSIKPHIHRHVATNPPPKHDTETERDTKKSPTETGVKTEQPQRGERVARRRGLIAPLYLSKGSITNKNQSITMYHLIECTEV